jgi:hypothetical protein
MQIETNRNRIREINKKLADLRHQELLLIQERHNVEEQTTKECKHLKVIYTDGFPHQSWDYDWDHYRAEMRVCLSCGMTEEGTDPKEPRMFANPVWEYKILTNKPIRRYCVCGNAGLKGTIDYEKRASSTFGEDTYEKRMCHYWAYVCDKLFAMPYAARVKKAMQWGYPA